MNQDNNEDLNENKNKNNCGFKFLKNKIFYVLLILILLFFFAKFIYGQYSIYDYQKRNIIIEEGPKRTINDYSHCYELSNGDILFVGGHTYEDGSVTGGYNAELYNLKENRFERLPNTINQLDIIKDTKQIQNYFFMLNSKGNIEVYDISKKIFFDYKEKKFNNEYIFPIEKQRYPLPGNSISLDEQYSLLINEKNNKVSYQIYDREKDRFIDIPKLKYSPFEYSIKNSIKISNKKFLLPINYCYYHIEPVYNTQIIKIKE